MAKTRTCFARSICCADDFLELPNDSQLLYFHLNFEADNDGVIDGMKKTLRAIGSTNEALVALVDAGYLLKIDDCYLIRDWCVHNKKDTHNYYPGSHQDVMAQVEQVSDRNRAYRLIVNNTDCDQSDSSQETVSNINELKVNKKENNESNQNKLNRENNKEPYTQPCPHCGEQCLATTTAPFYAVCDDHGQFEVSKPPGSLTAKT